MANLIRLILTSLILCGLSQGSTQKDSPKKNADKIEILGTWKVVSATDSGEKVPDAWTSKITFVFTEDAMSVQTKGKPPQFAKYSIDSSKTPKWLTIDQNDALSQGIYQLDGDTLRICISEGKKLERPTAFESMPNSVNDLLFVMKRGN